MFLPNPGILAAGSGVIPIGQQLFAGRDQIFEFVVPDGVTSVAIVCIGQGQSYRVDGINRHGGAGGSLACYNFVAVEPGELLQVSIGFSGARVLRYGLTVCGVTGASLREPGVAVSDIGLAPAVFFPGGRGTAATANSGNAGGAGAGGYTSAGANGALGSPARGGGGTSPMGGTAAGAAAGASATTTGLNYGGGGAWSGGSGGEGAPGCVRIIWGPDRAYPNTNTGDMAA